MVFSLGAMFRQKGAPVFAVNFVSDCTLGPLWADFFFSGDVGTHMPFRRVGCCVREGPPPK